MEDAADDNTPMPQPLHLLRPDDTHTSLVCIPEAMDALRNIKGPVKVCSLVGTQRQGKSSLLNLLHKRSCVPPGFGIGHYMDPKTHGLHFWSKPHPRTPDVTIIYLDTEGLDAPHVDQFYNWTLSAVSLLISDVYMYQSKGSIDTGSIDRLAMILRVAEQLRGDASSGIRKRSSGDNSDEGKSEWQKSGSTVDTGSSFLWLLRDHQLNMKYSPKEEMIEKLDSDALKTVRRCFEDYDCVPLPVPVNGGMSELQNMEQKSLEDLASEFREEFLVLERRILDKLRRPRILAGQQVTGPMLADVLEAYTASVQKKDGAMADIAALPTQREMLVSLAGDRAVKAGLQHYKDAMREVENQVVGHKALMTKHTTVLKESIHIFGDIALQVLDGDEVGKFKHNMIEKIVGWGTILSAESSSGSGSSGSSGNSGSSGSNKDVLFQKSGLKEACVFGPIWSANQTKLRDRCFKTLQDIYAPLHATLHKRLGIAINKAEDEDSLGLGDNDDGGKKQDDTTGKKQTAAVVSLPSLPKFMAAVAKVRSKYSKHEHVVTTPLSISTSILNAFERSRITPDTMLLMQGLFEQKTTQALSALNEELSKEMKLQIIGVVSMQEKNNAELTDKLNHQQEQQDKVHSKVTEAIETMKQNNVSHLERVERSIDEERGIRERSIELQQSSLKDCIEQHNAFKTNMTSYKEETATTLQTMRRSNSEQVENVKKLEQTLKEMLQASMKELSATQNQLHQDNQSAVLALTEQVEGNQQTLLNRVDRCDQSLVDLNDKHTAVREDIQNGIGEDIKTINVRFDQLVKDRTERESKMNQNIENVVLQLNNTLVQIEETNTRHESKTATALTTLSTTWESKQKESVESFSTMLENYGTKTEFTDLNNTSMKEIKVLKEFVRKEFADHSEGMTMTHTKVEDLESKLQATHETSISTLQDDLNVLKAGQEQQAKMNVDLRKALKNSLDKTKKNIVANSEKLVHVEEELLLRATIEGVETLKQTQEEASTLLSATVLEKLDEKVNQANFTELETKMVKNVQQLEEKMTTTNKETDQHIKTFRASLTDEIAEALSLCNTRLAAAEKATKEMTENSSSATKENLDQISMELKEKLNQMATQLTECKVDKDVVTMTEVDAACSALRSELIRRDELLESQLVDAHAQMTREAQLIVAPAKSQVENMRQQVNSLNERLALATESQGKKHEALNDQLKADVMLNMNTLTTQLNGLVEERQSSIQSTRQLESKVNKVYKTLSREITKGKGDREGLWGSLSELSCRISEIRSQIE